MSNAPQLKVDAHGNYSLEQLAGIVQAAQAKGKTTEKGRVIGWYHDSLMRASLTIIAQASDLRHYDMLIAVSGQVKMRNRQPWRDTMPDSALDQAIRYHLSVERAEAMERTDRARREAERRLEARAQRESEHAEPVL